MDVIELRVVIPTDIAPPHLVSNLKTKGGPLSFCAPASIKIWKQIPLEQFKMGLVAHFDLRLQSVTDIKQMQCFHLPQKETEAFDSDKMLISRVDQLKAGDIIFLLVQQKKEDLTLEELVAVYLHEGKKFRRKRKEDDNKEHEEGKKDKKERKGKKRENENEKEKEKEKRIRSVVNAIHSFRRFLQLASDRDNGIARRTARFYQHQSFLHAEEACPGFSFYCDQWGHAIQFSALLAAKLLKTKKRQTLEFLKELCEQEMEKMKAKAKAKQKYDKDDEKEMEQMDEAKKHEKEEEEEEGKEKKEQETKVQNEKEEDDDDDDDDEKEEEEQEEGPQEKWERKKPLKNELSNLLHLAQVAQLAEQVNKKRKLECT